MTFRTCHRNRLAIFTWLSFVVLFFRASSPMYAQTFWADNAGDWNTAANWSLGVPDAYNAIIASMKTENN